MHILFCFFSGISRKNSRMELCNLSNDGAGEVEILGKGEFTTYLAGWYNSPNPFQKTINLQRERQYTL